MRFFPHRLISVKGEPYIVRWFIWGSKGEGDGGRAIRLHHILQSDSLRDLHDHPYSFFSIILAGGYLEHTEQGKRRFRPGMINKKEATVLHALEIINKPAWTLVCTGKRKREWGFQTKDGWVRWQEYEGAEK